MLRIERFIASAMSMVRIEPEAPTSMPATISATLSSARPAAAAERPVNAFSSEITTGMSAPPIGSTNMFPSTAAATRIRMKRPSDSVPDAIAIAEPTHTASSPTLMNCWPGSWIGRPGRTSCSFPKAMFEPQNETDPMIAANRIGIRVSSSGLPPAASDSRYSTNEISATAPPPTPLNSATICGIAVIFTERAAGTPTAVPIATPEHDQAVVADRLDQERRDHRDRPCRPRR